MIDETQYPCEDVSMATSPFTDPEVAEFAGQLFFRLWRASHTRVAEAFKSVGLTPALFGVLNVLGARQGVIQQDIGAAIGIDPSTMVSLIDQLESAGRSVLDLLGLAQGIHRFVDGQEDRRFEGAERTAPTNRQRNRSHGHVVGGLPKVVAVVCAEGVPEPVELPTDRLDVRLSGLSAVLSVVDQPAPSLRRVAEPR